METVSKYGFSLPLEKFGVNLTTLKSAFILGFQMEEQQINQPGTQNNSVGFMGATPPARSTSKKNWKWLLVLILFLLVIGGVTFFVFKSSKSSSLEESPTPEATIGPVDTSSPTPLATPADKTKVSISVLNGTGIAGEAGLLVDQLKQLGYTDVKAGNATTQDATDTQVTFAESVGQDVVAEITSKLQSIYTNVTTNNSTLPSGIDIQIVTGLRKGQTAAPAATNAPAATDTPSASPTATP